MHSAAHRFAVRSSCAHPRIAAVFAWAAGASIAPHALAQSASGFSRVDARCGPSQMQSIDAHSDFTLTAHGECPAPRFGGLASINDSTTTVRFRPGSYLAVSDSSTDFFGTRDDAGSASGIDDITYHANDLVFTNIANPGQMGIITASMNFELAAAIATTGHSNCSASSPGAGVSFNLGAPGGQANGSISISGGGAPTMSGSFTGYANDGSTIAATTGAGGVDLGFPNTLFLSMNANTGLLYCDSPPPEFGAAAASILVQFPCGTPVFNLPPGYTVNSAQLGITNNIWSGIFISAQPAGALACAAGVAHFSVGATGIGPFHYQWQLETSPGVWQTLGNDPAPLTCGPGAFAFASPIDSPSVTIGVHGCPGPFHVRALVSNECGTTTSAPATLTISSCAGDADLDATVGLSDLAAIINCWTMSSSCNVCADLDGNGTIGLGDVAMVIGHWASTCP